MQDQALGTNFSRVGYYDRRDRSCAGPRLESLPLEYVPFVRTIGSANWPRSHAPGAGIDFFWLHLARVRESIAEGRVIPAWLPWIMPAGWTLVLLFSGFYLLKRGDSAGVT